MNRILIEFAKYVTIITVVLYTFITFRVALMKPGKGRNARSNLMAMFMYLIHAMSFLVLYLSTENIQLLILYVCQVIVFLVFGLLYKKCYNKMSLPIFQNMRMLLMFGFIMITRLSLEKGIRQFVIVSVALALCFIVPMMIRRYRTLRNFTYLYAVAGILGLLLVFFFGTEQYGAKNWIVIGKIGFQPSEFIKLLYIFFIASVLSKKNRFKDVILVTALAAIHVIILVLEKDLGGAFLFFITYIFMLYSATGKGWYLFGGIAGGTVASILAYQIFPHVRVRVAAFIDPFSLIEKEGYQTAQSLFAIGTGGFTGMGLTQGLPTNIPVADSDFIFSAISEEFGAIVGICICLICFSCFVMFINISVKFKDPFYKIMALGISIMYISQVFLNIGGAIKCIPSTGVTLPLVSYGGSSVLSSIIMFSIIQGMYVLEMHQEEGLSASELKALKVQKRPKYNRLILTLMYVFSGMIFVTIGYYGYFVVAKGKTFINNSYNKRQELLAETITRGEILSSDGQVLAKTVETQQGKEERIYPYGSIFCHAVGRVQHGLSGIEQAESFTMLTCSENPISQAFNTLKGEKNQGDCVITTLDTRLQKAAYDALGNQKGAVVVMEPSTGKILAMVSKPDYDPNKVNSQWESLNKEDQSCLLNRATQGLYPPGSTFKILTVLEYMRENPDYKNYRYTCTGEDKINQVTIHCPSGEAHGEQNLKQSFANSCNTSFANLGSSLDMKQFQETCNEFYFNRKLPTDLKTMRSQFLLNESSDPIDYPQTVIGLGKTLMTPLHNAMVVSAIANQGVMMKPYLVDSIQNRSGQVISVTEQVEAATVMSSQEANVLTDYMKEVIDNGTGTRLKGRKLSVAGKTGTATYDTSKNPHAWFVGFAPADHPEIVVSVIVESAGGGSRYAIPVAKQILDTYEKIR